LSRPSQASSASESRRSQNIFLFTIYIFGQEAHRFRKYAVYELGMLTELPDATEKLIRVRTTRRGADIELRVHYEIVRAAGCSTIHLFAIEEVD